MTWPETRWERGHRHHTLVEGEWRSRWHRNMGSVEFRGRGASAAYAWSLDRLHGPAGECRTLRAAKRAVERAVLASRPATTASPDEIRRHAGPWSEGRRIPFMCSTPSCTPVDEVDRVVRRSVWRGGSQWGCYAALSQAEQEMYGGGFSAPGYG